MRRTISTTTQQSSRQIRDLLQSVLITELLAPSSRIWLVSAWIIDAPVLDNRGGELAGLVPSWPERELLLSEVLAEFLAGGTQLVVVTNDHHANRQFPTSVRAAATAVDASRQLCITAIDGLSVDHERGLHRKRLVTERAVLWGSMNFTYSGLEKNAEDVQLETASDDVAAAINVMQQLHPSPATA